MTQLRLDFNAPTQGPRAQLADGTFVADLDLPERIWTIALWRPYAGLVIAGIKTIETRTWRWPTEYGKAWLAIYAALNIDGEAMKRIGKMAEEHVGPGQAIIGMVRVVRCRPLVPADEPQSLFYAPARWAWELERPIAFRRPISCAEAGLKKGPQKFARVDRRVIVSALAA